MGISKMKVENREGQWTLEDGRAGEYHCTLPNPSSTGGDRDPRGLADIICETWWRTHSGEIGHPQKWKWAPMPMY